MNLGEILIVTKGKFTGSPVGNQNSIMDLAVDMMTKEFKNNENFSSNYKTWSRSWLASSLDQRGGNQSFSTLYERRR